MNGQLKVTLDGRGALTLRDSNYVTSGGEGSIYRAGATIVKIYADKNKMVRDGMDQKIKLLALLKHDSIVAPEGMVFDNGTHPIGFYMPFANGEPMPRVFISDFRARTGFSDKDAIALADRMREVVQFAHGHKALLVDANELNWLVDVADGKPVPKVIDVDSWSVGRWPATVIMPSIRDWHAKDFNDLTDWFAWGVVTFQIFTGIHPYKGKIDGYKPGDLIQRMKDNASVFDGRARLPHSVRDFSCIPGPLLDWFRATFQDGARSAPPSPRDTAKPAVAARVVRATTTASGALVYEKIFGGAGEGIVVRTWGSGYALLDTGELIDLSTRKVCAGLESVDGEVVKTSEGVLLADFDRIMPALDLLEGHKVHRIPFGIAARRFFRSGERLFAITDQDLLELNLRMLGKPTVTAGQRVSIRPYATRWFDGVGIQDALGASFLILPTETGLVQPRVKDLDGISVVSAKAGGRFASFVGLARGGNYRKIELTFDKTFSSYSSWEGGADGPDLNLAILPSGVTASIINDGELTLFVPANGNINRIADRDITTDMRLGTWGSQLVYIKEGAVWRVTMRP